MIWNPNKECMPREQMRELQGKRLCNWCSMYTIMYLSIVIKCRKWT